MQGFDIRRAALVVIGGPSKGQARWRQVQDGADHAEILTLRINDGLSRPAIVHAARLDWVPSPVADVDRRMLYRVESEVARDVDRPLRSS